MAVGGGVAACATRLRCNLKPESKCLGQGRGCLGLRNNTYGLLISSWALRDLVCKAALRTQVLQAMAFRKRTAHPAAPSAVGPLRRCLAQTQAWL